MAQNVIINGVTYQNVPSVNIPKSGGGTAAFIDTTITSDAAAAGDMLNGKKSWVNGVLVTGNIASKSAATYTPTTSDQTIAALQFLQGAQTIKGDSNLQAQYIAQGISIFGIQGTLQSPVISQDSTTKVLSIS